MNRLHHPARARRAVLAAALLAACAAPERSVPPVEHPDGGCSLCDLARDKRGSVVRIQTPQGSGTGTVVSDRGRLLTNAHVARRLGPVWIGTHDGELVRGRVVRLDRDEDLALIQADAPWVLWRPIQIAAEEAAPGSFATSIGYPAEDGWLVDHGRVEGLLPAGGFADVSYLQSDVAIFPGGSGGPLLDARGELVGLMTGRRKGDAEGPSYARPAAALRRFLEISG